MADILDNNRLDSAALATLRDLQDEDDPTFFNDLIDSFISESQAILVEMETLNASQNFSALSRAAHRLKGGASNIGATQLTNLCLKLELLAKQEPPIPLDQVQALFVEIQTEFVWVSNALLKEYDQP